MKTKEEISVWHAEYYRKNRDKIIPQIVRTNKLRYHRRKLERQELLAKVKKYEGLLGKNNEKEI